MPTNLGMAGPQAVGGSASSSPWYDSNRLAALRAQYGGRTLNHGELLGLLTPQTGIHALNAPSTQRAAGGMDSDGPDVNVPSTFGGADGQIYHDAGQDAQGNQLVQWSDNSNNGWQNPTGSGHDRVQPTYRLDANGNATPISTGDRYTPGAWTDYGRSIAELAAVMGTVGFGGAALAGAGTVGSSTAAATTVGGTGAGLSPEALAYGASEVGASQAAGYGGQLVASAEPGLGGALSAGAGGSSSAAADAAAMALSEGAYPASLGAAASGGAASAAGGGSALFGANGLLGTGVSATDLAGYAGSALRFAGSPAGGALLGAAGGLLGSGHGLNSASESVQNRIDPRMARYIYGQDGNSGLLGNVNNLYSSQLAQGGLNDQQRQGMASQLDVLNDPSYQSGYTQMRNTGNSLLGQPVAGNPFNNGQMQVPSNMRPVGLMGK